MLKVKTYLKNKEIPSGGEEVALYATEEILEGVVVAKWNSAIDREISLSKFKKLDDIEKAFVEEHSVFEDGYYLLSADNLKHIHTGTNDEVNVEEVTEEDGSILIKALKTISVDEEIVIYAYKEVEEEVEEVDDSIEEVEEVDDSTE